MINTSTTWFGKFLSGDDPTGWLNGLAEIVAAALAEDPSRSQPATCDVGAKIIGPVVFGRNCIVGHGALVVGPAVFGDNSVIGHCSEVSRSIFGDDTHAPHFNYIGDSVLGSRVNLGAGVKLANVRFDKKNIRGGAQKLGSILGDDVQIGCNAVLDPGTVVGAGVWFAGVHLPAQTDGAAYTRETVKDFFYK